MIRNYFFDKVFGKYLYWIQNWYAGAEKARYRRAGLWAMSKSTQFCVLAELLTDVRTRHKTALGVQSNLLEKKEQLLCTLYMYTYCQLWNGSYGVVIEIQAKPSSKKHYPYLVSNQFFHILHLIYIMNNKDKSTKKFDYLQERSLMVFKPSSTLKSVWCAGLKLYTCEILKLLIRATVSHMWSRLVWLIYIAIGRGPL